LQKQSEKTELVLEPCSKKRREHKVEEKKKDLEGKTWPDQAINIGAAPNFVGIIIIFGGVMLYVRLFLKSQLNF
jgi:hypothetical protein